MSSHNLLTLMEYKSLPISGIANLTLTNGYIYYALGHTKLYRVVLSKLQDKSEGCCKNVSFNIFIVVILKERLVGGALPILLLV